MGTVGILAAAAALANLREHNALPRKLVDSVVSPRTQTVQRNERNPVPHALHNV